MKATLDEWFEIVSRGTSGDQVHDILYSWKKDRANFAALQAELDAARARIAELETDDELNRKLIGSITKQFDKARARIAELEAEADAADACAIAQDGRIAELEAALSGTGFELYRAADGRVGLKKDGYGIWLPFPAGPEVTQ